MRLQAWVRHIQAEAEGQLSCLPPSPSHSNPQPTLFAIRPPARRPYMCVSASPCTHSLLQEQNRIADCVEKLYLRQKQGLTSTPQQMFAISQLGFSLTCRWTYFLAFYGRTPQECIPKSSSVSLIWLVCRLSERQGLSKVPCTSSQEADR
jgi:hypothetical protein